MKQKSKQSSKRGSPNGSGQKNELALTSNEISPNNNTEHVSAVLKGTAAMRRENERLKNEVKHLEEECLDKETELEEERRTWSIEREHLENQVKELRESARKRLKVEYLGRNKFVGRKYDAYDIANISEISAFLRSEMMPHHKFWHTSWMEFLPKHRGSFCAKIMRHLDVPDNEDKYIYWNKHLIALINQKRIEWRSQVVTRIRKQYNCEFTCLIEFLLYLYLT